MEENKLKELDSYNILELMGLSAIPDEDKNNILYDMNSLIWNEFLSSRLDNLLTLNQMQEVKKMLDNKKEIKEVLAFITGKVPNFTELLLEYTRNAKVRFIKEHFNAEMKDLNRALEVASSEKVKNDIIDKIKVFSEAKKFADEYEWKRLIELLKKQK